VYHRLALALFYVFVLYVYCCTFIVHALCSDAALDEVHIGMILLVCFLLMSIVFCMELLVCMDCMKRNSLFSQTVLELVCAHASMHAMMISACCMTCTCAHACLNINSIICLNLNLV
jgi:hypothetical protein